MANSLQDQLLKAGLVKAQQLKQTQTGKRKQRRQGAAIDDEARRLAATAAAEKQRQDRERNRQRDEAARQRAEVVAMWQLVRDQRLPRDGGDVAFNFSDGTALKRLYVSAQQQAGLVGGHLAIVRHDAFYELVPATVAERVAAHDPTLVLVLNRPAAQPAPPAETDDPYASYQVPDDLIW